MPIIEKVSSCIYIILCEGMNDSSISKEIDKALGRALEDMIQKYNTDSLRADVHPNALIAQVEDATLPEPHVNITQNLDWEEGMEDFQHYSADYIWTLFAREPHHLPFFNAFIDRTGLHNPWDHPAFFRNVTNNPRISPLTPRWYQLMGILKGLDLAFSGKPLLLMDGVGFGKTLQLAGIFVMLKWFRDYYAQYGDFPGDFGEFFDLVAMH